jgi:4-azaleucine resistance transporter AzlC
MLPLLVGIVPFGLLVGVTAASTEIGGLLGSLTSVIIFAGAAQLATIELIDQGAAALVVIATGLVINSRHLMYSVALAGPFGEFPRRWRLALPYLLTDQSFVLSATRWEAETSPRYRRWFFLGTGLGLWLPWQATTLTGVLVGTEVPESWSLEFAVPLVFLGLLTAGLKNPASVAAAATGGVVAVAAAGMPWNLGLIVAIGAGVGTGVLVRRWGT